MYIVLGIIAVLALIVISVYNSLVGKRNQVSNIRSGVDTQLKRRFDLIPNLVATVKQYITHERELLENISALRSGIQKAAGDEQRFALNGELSNLISKLNVVVENYPELKANENVMHLQKTLNEIEEQISAARRAYNAAVTDYNNTVEMFPSNIVASWAKFHKAAFFEVPKGQDDPHDVHELLTAKFALVSSNLTLNLSALTAPLKIQAAFVGSSNLNIKSGAGGKFERQI